MKYLASQRYCHPELGVVHIIVRSNACNFTARWKNDELLLTIPKYTTLEEYNETLAELMPVIVRNKPESRFFYVGWTYDTSFYHFEVVAGTDKNFHREVDYDKHIVTFKMATDIQPDGSLEFNKFVNEGLEEYAKILADSVVIPEALKLAGELGVKPKSISIGRGTNVLGRCYGSGRILFSRNLIFYPADHRRYVYAHEFAHLTHMNHGPAFHALLDKYLDGREQELKKASDEFVIPIIK